MLYNRYILTHAMAVRYYCYYPFWSAFDRCCQKVSELYQTERIKFYNRYHSLPLYLIRCITKILPNHIIIIIMYLQGGGREKIMIIHYLTHRVCVQVTFSVWELVACMAGATLCVLPVNWGNFILFWIKLSKIIPITWTSGGRELALQRQRAKA